MKYPVDGGEYPEEDGGGPYEDEGGASGAPYPSDGRPEWSWLLVSCDTGLDTRLLLIMLQTSRPSLDDRAGQAENIL